MCLCWNWILGEIVLVLIRNCFFWRKSPDGELESEWMFDAVWCNFLKPSDARSSFWSEGKRLLKHVRLQMDQAKLRLWWIQVIPFLYWPVVVLLICWFWFTSCSSPWVWSICFILSLFFLVLSVLSIVRVEVWRWRSISESDLEIDFDRSVVGGGGGGDQNYFFLALAAKLIDSWMCVFLL